jgi:tRNA 2-thiouridine synthesizing protein A
MSNLFDQNDIHPDASVDLGDLGCGDLVMDLMKAMRPLKAGQILHVHATDPAAPIDIGAWCAMQNCELLAGPTGKNKADYFIRKGETSHG